jgi:hypothetical protein
MRQSIIFLTIFFSVNVYGQETALKVKFPKVDQTKTYFYSPIFQTETYHTIEGIGNLYQPFDSIKDNHVFITSLNMDEVTEDSLIRKCENPKNKLKIIVDTSQVAVKELNFNETFSLNKIYSSYPRQVLTKDKKNIFHKINLAKDTTINVIAQPVYIANLSKEIRYLKGISGHISVTQQAKDKNNKWRDIETPIRPGCGMVRYICELNPDDFVLTTVLRFNGNYKTQLRIKLEANSQTYYSAPFIGFIDYLQIENPKIKMIEYTPYEKL